MKPSLFLLVLYVEDIEASREFYAALGLGLVREQHGRGPVHYSVTLDGGEVVELYPRGARPATRVRLGLTVPDIDAAIESVRQLNSDIRAHDDSSAIVVDPDGNSIELRD
ncbi:VOC family protein [Nocardia tengchongensis]|uniref:VOC family protein n=1 Tax=Nocardia tengchongensis TaxID=2055889 RepID=UPI003698077D